MGRRGLARRAGPAPLLHEALSIYEVHLGSWRRVPEEGDRFLDYRELADQLADYVGEMGFTHVELLPVMEHPFYGSGAIKGSLFRQILHRIGRLPWRPI